MVRKPWVDALWIAGLFGILALFGSRLANNLPYGYDESDYVYAAGRGVCANYLDSGTISISQFARVGLGRGSDPAQARGLSEYVRRRPDVLFYRHWHGPLYYYWLTAIISHWKFDEAAAHLWMLVFPAAIILLLYFGVRWAVPGEAGQTAAWISALIYASSYTGLKAGSMIGPHSLFVFLTLAAVILLMKLVGGEAVTPAEGAQGGGVECTSGLRYWYAALVLTGLAAATLEVAYVMVATLVAVAWMERRNTFAGWRTREWLRFGAQSAGIILLALVLVWPAALLKLSAPKAYAFMFYLSVFRKGAWGQLGFFDSWRILLAQSAVEWILIAVATALCIRLRKIPRVTLPPLVFGAIMLASVLRVVSTEPRYAAMYLPPLILFASVVLGIALENKRAWIRSAIIAAIAVLMIWNTNARVQPVAADLKARAWAPIRLIRERHLESASLLVPSGMIPTLHLYFPDAILHGYKEGSTAALVAGGVDAILAGGDKAELMPLTPVPARVP